MHPDRSIAKRLDRRVPATMTREEKSDEAISESTDAATFCIELLDKIAIFRLGPITFDRPSTYAERRASVPAGHNE
jgi:hypothetical protein